MAIIRCSIVVDPFYQNNRLFNLDDPIVNRDNCLAGFALLRSKLEDAGFSLDTDDLAPIDDVDVIIFNEMPKPLPDPEVRSKAIVILFECQVIKPHSWDPAHMAQFPIIMTWHDELVNGTRYRKICYPVDLTTTDSTVAWGKKRLCTLVAGNKTAWHSLELYSERRRAIAWFERWHAEEFEFFGPDWDRIILPGLLRPLNRYSELTRRFAPKHPCYRGLAQNKRATIAGYKFCICFENAHSISGYITEKIIDCLAAGCVPIYWGAPNIREYVPQDCFIDFRMFKGYEELYDHLSQMTEEQHARMVKAGREFLGSESGKLFGPVAFAEKVSQAIIDLSTSVARI